MGGVKNVDKMTPPPLFWVGNHESFGFFFDFEPKKCFRVPTAWGFVWGGVGREMQFMHFLAIFAMSAVLATSVTSWYPLRGV